MLPVDARDEGEAWATHGLDAVSFQKLNRAPSAEAAGLFVATLNHPLCNLFGDGIDALKEALPVLHIGLQALVQDVAHNVRLSTSLNLYLWN